MYHLSIMGDVVLPSYFDSSKHELNMYCDSKLLDCFQNASLNIINLECVLTDSDKATDKWGVPLKADPSYITFLKSIPNVVVNLSNNHIFDYGLKGLEDTIHILKENEIPFFGVQYEDESYNCYVANIGNRSVAIVGICEQDSLYSSYVHSVDIAQNIFLLQELSNTYSDVVVLYHGGVEFYPYPTPNEQKLLRSFVDAGASLIVCQHNHCISATEIYKKGTIIYGQGSFLFANRPEIQANILDESMWNTGMIVDYMPENKCPVQYHFYQKCTLPKNDYSDDSTTKISKTLFGFLESVSDNSVLQKYTSNLVIQNFVTDNWKRYCNQQASLQTILSCAIHENLSHSWLKRIKYTLKCILGCFDIPSEYKRTRHYLTCETYLEQLKTLIESRNEDY